MLSRSFTLLLGAHVRAHANLGLKHLSLESYGLQLICRYSPDSESCFPLFVAQRSSERIQIQVERSIREKKQSMYRREFC